MSRLSLLALGLTATLATAQPIDFTTPEGWAYDGVIELPDPLPERPWGVLLVGGARASTLDWTLPGWITPDGQDAHSAATLSRGLRDAGLVVMRWQAIRRDDPAFVPSYEQTEEQARRALAAFMAAEVVPPERTVVLGHSLGARRAVALLRAEPRLAGVVLMAPSSVDDVDRQKLKQVRVTIQAQLTYASLEGHDFVSREEWVALQRRATEDELKALTIEAVDRDGDGLVRTHELLAALLGVAGERYLAGPARGSDLLVERGTPVLILSGGMDPTFVLDAAMIAGRVPAATWRYYDDLGHYLGPTVPGVVVRDGQRVSNVRLGGIAPRVVDDLIAWLRTLR
jgi:pimeloyl-ACP methyl ester carboxylesterase